MKWITKKEEEKMNSLFDSIDESLDKQYNYIIAKIENTEDEDFTNDGIDDWYEILDIHMDILKYLGDLSFLLRGRL